MMMSDFVEHCVEYENYSSYLVSHFRNLFHRQILVDTTLMCNSNTLKVHKVVLVAASSYFQNLLKQRTGEVLITLKMNFEVLKSIIEFIYSGKTSFLGIHKGELISAARFLNIIGLVELETNHTEILPEFQTPIVFNQPSHVMQENSQLDLDGCISHDDKILPFLQTNTDGNGDGIIRIPIEIKSEQYTNIIRKRDHMRCELKKYGEFSMDKEGTNEENLLNKAARKLRKIETESINAIHQLKYVQENVDKTP